MRGKVHVDFVFQAEDGIRDLTVTGVQTCALPIYAIPFQKSSMMGSDPNGWPDLVEWKYLSSKLTLPSQNSQPIAGSSDREQLEGQDMLTVGGSLDITGTLADLRINRGSVDPAPSTPDPGDFAFELLNAAGQVLSSTSFGVDFVVPDVGTVSKSAFRVSTLFLSGTTQARIRKGVAVLYSRT